MRRKVCSPFPAQNGKLTKAENVNLPVQHRDGNSLTFPADDKTKFLDGSCETIKLGDFNTGDSVAGRGTLKNGVFVAAELRKAQAYPRMPRLRLGPAVPFGRASDPGR